MVVSSVPLARMGQAREPSLNESAERRYTSPAFIAPDSGDKETGDSFLEMADLIDESALARVMLRAYVAHPT